MIHAAGWPLTRGFPGRLAPPGWPVAHLQDPGGVIVARIRSLFGVVMPTMNGVTVEEWLSTCPPNPAAIVSVALTREEADALDRIRGRRSRSEALRDLVRELVARRDTTCR